MVLVSVTVELATASAPEATDTLSTVATRVTEDMSTRRLAVVASSFCKWCQSWLARSLKGQLGTCQSTV